MNHLRFEPKTAFYAYNVYFHSTNLLCCKILTPEVLAEEWTGGLSPHDSTTSPFSRCPHEIQDLKVHHPEPLEEEHIVPGGLVPEGVLLVQEVLKPKALIRLEGKLSIGSPGTAPGPHAADQRGMSRDGTVTSAPPEQLPCSPRACHCSLCSAHC